MAKRKSQRALKRRAALLGFLFVNLRRHFWCKLVGFLSAGRLTERPMATLEIRRDGVPLGYAGQTHGKRNWFYLSPAFDYSFLKKLF